MSCVRKRRGKWVVDYRDVSGKRRWKTVDGTRKDADDRLAEIVGSGRKATDSKRTFKEAANEWMDVHVKANCKRSTWYEYDSAMRIHLIPAFGPIPFLKITREMVKKLVADKVKSGLSRSSVRNLIVPLREMFNHAIDDGAALSNPASRLGRFNYARGDGKKVDPLTKSEVTKLLETMREKMPHYCPLILCAARTGMRAGELAALQWRDIDFNGRFITVCRNMSRGELGTPKNHKSRRVDMSLQLTNILETLLAYRKADAVRRNPQAKDKALAAVMESFVFIREDARQLDPNDLRRQILYKALDLAEVRRVRFHDLRHTFASLLIAQGESLTYIRDQLGHYSIQMTVDIYGHLVPGGNRAAVDKLDDGPGGSPAQAGSKTVADDPQTDPKYV